MKRRSFFATVLALLGVKVGQSWTFANGGTVHFDTATDEWNHALRQIDMAELAKPLHPDDYIVIGDSLV